MIEFKKNDTSSEKQLSKSMTEHELRDFFMTLAKEVKLLEYFSEVEDLKKKGLYRKKIEETRRSFFEGLSASSHQKMRKALGLILCHKEIQRGLMTVQLYLFCEYFKSILNSPLGTWDLNWLNVTQDDLRSLPNYIVPEEVMSPIFDLRIHVEQYVQESDTIQKQMLLKTVKAQLLDYKKGEHAPFCQEPFVFSDKSGTHLAYSGLLASNLIQEVYRMNDDNLSELFYQHLPHPREEHFKDQSLPDFLKRKKEKEEQGLNEALDTISLEQFNTIEKSLRQFQRKFRRDQRLQQEKHRIPEYSKAITMIRTHKQWQTLPKERAENFDEYLEKRMAQKKVEKLEPTTNMYFPKKCTSQLAHRIIDLASQIKFIQTIYHKTHETALKSICDEGLFGQQTLTSTLRVFKRAALEKIDRGFGDVNVVCLTAGHGAIDPLAEGKVSITFDFNKIQQAAINAPSCSFFKQLDFGFKQKKQRPIHLDQDFTLVFDHTSEKGECLEIKMCVDQDKYALLAHHELISYDVEHLEQVLILNFFRFLEQLKFKADDKSADAYIQKFYQTLNAMGDARLKEVLTQIGLNASDTMEFNFYGAHQIDFNTVISISKSDTGPDKKSYVLKMKPLIEQLQQGQLTLLSESQKAFPELYRSFRFIDFLSFHTDNKEVLETLNSLRSQCLVPGWYPKNERLNDRKTLKNT